MEILPRGARTNGPEAWFTGQVEIEPITRGAAAGTTAVNAVHFSAGARTAWHSHSHGQTLHVIEGEALIQSRGESIHTLHAGDTSHTPAEEWHWHGATPEHPMMHLSITEGQATWGDHVTDAEYHGGPAT